MVKIVSIAIPDWVDEEEIKNLVKNYIKEKLSKVLRNSVDRETYLKFLELMGISIKHMEFELEEELNFLKKMRQREKARTFSYDRH